MSRPECKNVRREIEEAGNYEELPAVRDHLRSCNECTAFDDEQRKLRSMVADLGGVVAPADFDFKLRARLAASPPDSNSFSLSSIISVRSAALATLVLLVGIVLVLINSRDRSGSVALSTTPSNQTAVEKKNPQPEVSAPAPAAIAEVVPSGPVTVGSVTPRRSRGNTSAQFIARNSPVSATDLSTTPARVLRPETGLGETVFPLGASYQSLKVSVDDGRGSNRIISLPSVSFGSSRALAQNPKPIMASTRDSW